MRAIWAAIGLLGATGVAHGRAFRVDQLPNTSGCAMCHVNPAGGGVRTPVGNDTLLALMGQNVVWAELCVLDSDGDSLSNGAELGDPGCNWRMGQPPPVVQSDPNDSDDPVEGGGMGGEGGGVGEPDRFCLEACDTIATCAVADRRCPELRPRDQADAAALCATECVGLPALPIAVERAANCDEMVDFLNGASPTFADYCGIDPNMGEGGAGGGIEPACVPFCERVANCAAQVECPSVDAVDGWCPDGCANQPALRVLAEDAETCDDLLALLEVSGDGFADLCAGGEGGMGGEGGAGGMGGAPEPEPQPDAMIADMAPADAAVDATPDAAPAPAEVEGCGQAPGGAPMPWLGLLLGLPLAWRRRR